MKLLLPFAYLIFSKTVKVVDNVLKTYPSYLIPDISSLFSQKCVNYTSKRAFLYMPCPKWSRISQKSITFTGLLFLPKKGIIVIFAIQRIDISVFASTHESDPNPLYRYLQSPAQFPPLTSSAALSSDSCLCDLYTSFFRSSFTSSTSL